MVEKPVKTKFKGKVTAEAVELVKQRVMSKITGRSLPEKVVGLDDEYR